jgi:hypothetical protein
MSDDKDNASDPSMLPEIPLVRSMFYREAYANSFRVRLSPIDLTIVFSANTEIPGPAIQDEASVSMSLAAAKILSLHLSRTIEGVERKIGRIRIPRAGIPTDQQREQLLRVFETNPLTDV